MRQQSLIGEYFLDCQIGRAKKQLPDGGTVPVEQTSSTIPLDLINNGACDGPTASASG